MKKMVSLLGLMVALSLGAIAWIGLPATDVMASPDKSPVCASDISLDEGYGVSRHVPAACAR
jgi:hypothetical protein